MWKSKFYGAFVLNRRVDLHAIDTTPARRRGDAGSSPLDGASTAASSPRTDLVKNYRVHPTHWLISTQVLNASGRRAFARRDAINEALSDVALRAVWKSTNVSGALLGDDAAVLARSSGEEPASPRHRAGVASMAWRSTRRFRTNAP